MAHAAPNNMLAALPYVPPPAEYYNTDCGHKKCFARQVQDSPNRMSIMRSGAVRFQRDKSKENSPFGVYNLDTAHRKTIASRVRDSKQFIAAAFVRDKTERNYDLSTEGPDVQYDVGMLYNGAPPNVSQCMEQSPVRYSILRSKQRKLAKQLMSDAPDVDYDTNRLHKASMTTSMMTSPILYANMSKSRTTRSNLSQPSSCPADIGPGSYDYPYPKDVRVSLILNQNPLSSLQSRAPRLATDKVDPTKNLGSTWRLQRDKQYWGQGTTISKAEYLRPQYLPASYASKAE